MNNKTHIVFCISRNVMIVPYDEEFFKYLQQIHEKYPESCYYVDAYNFHSKNTYWEWMDEIVPDVQGGMEIRTFTHPVDKEKWNDYYMQDQDWKDFDLQVKNAEDYLQMMNKELPIHPFFINEQSDKPRLIHLLYAKEEEEEERERPPTPPPLPLDGDTVMHEG